MSERDIIMFLIIAGIMGGLFLIMRSQNRMFRRALDSRLKNGWGKVPEREYTAEELDSIASYARLHRTERFYIDDITWNDLNLERAFMLMNNTQSACGEDYLYHILRSPCFDEKKLQERNRLINFFTEHPKERLAVSEALAGIGKMPGMSVSAYIRILKDAQRYSVWRFVLQALAVFLSFVLFFVSPLAGVFAGLGFLIFNMYTHFVFNQKMEPYIKCFVCILRLSKAGEKLAKLEFPELSSYLGKIEHCSKSLKKLRRQTSAVVASAVENNGLEGIILMYANMIFLLDLIQFQHALGNFEGHEAAADTLMENMGILDSAIAIASFREYLPYFCIPKLTGGTQAQMEVEKLYHPFLAEPVANSIHTKKGVLITGSNASGKSTFLKSIALNAIFAQTIYTCTAKAYCASRFKVMTSMALRDNLEDGESYYIVEIKALKRILEESQKPEPLLCIVDEVLRGTNTVERIAASSRILESLCKEQVLVFAATHDIELSYILEGICENYHFEENISQKDVVFDYLLHKGRAVSRNAIALLELLGYDKEMVRNAKKAAEKFEKSGSWDLLLRTGE